MRTAVVLVALVAATPVRAEEEASVVEWEHPGSFHPEAAVGATAAFPVGSSSPGLGVGGELAGRLLWRFEPEPKDIGELLMFGLAHLVLGNQVGVELRGGAGHWAGTAGAGVHASLKFSSLFAPNRWRIPTVLDLVPAVGILKPGSADSQWYLEVRAPVAVLLTEHLAVEARVGYAFGVGRAATMGHVTLAVDLILR